MYRFKTLLIIVLLSSPMMTLAETDTDPTSAIHLAALKSYRKQFSPDGSLPFISEKITSPTKKVVAEQRPTLDLVDLVKNVVEHNQELQQQATKLDISEVEAEKTAAIFEPDFVSSLKMQRNSQKNTVQESLNRLLASTYSERNWDFSTGLEGLLKTGAEFNLGYDYRRLSNSVTQSLVDENEYQMYLGVSLVQPLLKNFGVETTTAAIRSAKIESQVSFQDYRQTMMRIVHETARAYWDYHFAEQKVLLRKDSVRIADQILTDNQQRQRIGKMTDVDVFEALVAVSSRKSLLRTAEQEFVAAANRLRTLLSVSTSETPLGVTAKGAGKTNNPLPDKQQQIALALKLKPKYLRVIEKLKQSDIKIAYAKNQRWPELDLMASYGLNGLGFSNSESWRQIKETSFQSWGVGIEFRQPIFGGKASKSDYQKAELEKKRQLYELKNLEIELINSIDTALFKIKSTGEQFADAQQSADIQKKLLDLEQASLIVGKSNSRKMLEKEDLYREARETLLQNQVKYQLAQLELELADGSILRNKGVEVMEIY